MTVARSAAGAACMLPRTLIRFIGWTVHAAALFSCQWDLERLQFFSLLSGRTCCARTYVEHFPRRRPSRRVVQERRLF